VGASGLAEVDIGKRIIHCFDKTHA
jgi:hypothetical protein